MWLYSVLEGLKTLLSFGRTLRAVEFKLNTVFTKPVQTAIGWVLIAHSKFITSGKSFISIKEAVSSTKQTTFFC